MYLLIILKKRTIVKEYAITPIGIATDVVSIKSNYNTYIQKEAKLSPSKWFYTSNTENVTSLINVNEN